jgi:hypothetical protein
LGRVAALDTSKIRNLLIGVDKSLLKDKDVKLGLEKSPWFAKFGFEFSQFPTPRQLVKAVDL